MQDRKLRKLILAACFAAIIFLCTWLIKIPIPNGYVHLGDGFIYIGAMLLPLPYALAASALGGALADILGGFTAYAPFTATIKLLMALIIALFARRSHYIAGKSDNKVGRGNIGLLILALLLATVVNCGGYFSADTLLFGIAAALASLPMNLAQSAAGVLVFFVFLPFMAKAMKSLD